MKVKPGSDFYIYQLLIRIISFLIVAIFSSKASKSTDYLSSSYISALGYQFCILVGDRILYLIRATKLKMLFHMLIIFSIFYSHMVLSFNCFTTDFDKSMFITDCIYLFYSALQISYGYADLVGPEVSTNINYGI